MVEETTAPEENTVPQEEEKAPEVPAPEEATEKEAPKAAEEKSSSESLPAASKGEKFLSCLGYISFFCILPLVLRPNSKFCQLHGKQGLIITLFFLLVAWIRVFSLTFWIMLLFLHLVIAIAGIVQAAMGRYFKMPLIYQMVKKLDFNE